MRAPVMFDLAHIAAARLSAAGDRVRELTANPAILPVLEALRSRQVPLGICFDAGSVPPEEYHRALRRAGLLGYFDPSLIWLEGRSPSALSLHLAGLKLAASDLVEGLPLFVSDEAAGRALARAADLLTAPDPVLVDNVLTGEQPLLYLRIDVPDTPRYEAWRELLRARPLAPLHFSPGAPGLQAVVYAIAGADTVAALRKLDFRVMPLGAPDEPQGSDVYLVTHHEPETGPAQRVGSWAVPQFEDHLLEHTSEGLLLAVPPGQAAAILKGTGSGHFHASRLFPSHVLLALPTPAPDATFPPDLSPGERRAFERWVSPGAMQHEVNRYSGAQPLHGPGAGIVSRNLFHPDNPVAVRALALDFAGMDGGRLRVGLHPFFHEEVPAANVEAILPGSGLGGVVIVSAHLDSIVARGAGSATHASARDPAPGADDDASGIAAVLCAARALLELAATGVTHREIRFVLFNAEESQRVGSARYAAACKARGDNIVAVLHMDMVGYDGGGERSFEVHAGGHVSAEVGKRSIALRELVATLGPALSTSTPPLVPQRYPGMDGDPADGWSDHTSFHSIQVPACLVSEDFWPGPEVGSSDPDDNPHYHSLLDQTIDAAYAADIARAVAAAAWIAATR